jgi:tetratricopeptide (TPR) repeat protein
MRARAEKGDAKAEYSLGYMYYHGKGAPQDYAEAVRWYRKAAEQGDARAEAVIGSTYFYGKGVAQDYAEAVRWYRKAAEQGDPEGQDYSEAISWYRKAAYQGDAQSEHALGYMYYYGQGLPRIIPTQYGGTVRPPITVTQMLGAPSLPSSGGPPLGKLTTSGFSFRLSGD